MTPIGKAERELKDFLEKNPHLKEYQKEVERRLIKAFTTENRMEVLKFMLDGCNIALSKELRKISNIARSVKEE